MKTIIKLVCIALILASGTSFFKVKAEIDYSYEYQWRDIPAAGAHKLDVYLSYLYYTDLETSCPKLEKTSLPSKSKIYMKDDSIYFHIVDIPSPRKRTHADGYYYSFRHYSGWMKGIVEDNKIKFLNEEILADVTTTIQNPDSINVSSENTQIKLYNISEIGALEWEYTHTITDSHEGSIRPLELSGEDITGDFHKETDLIYNLNGGFMASQEELESITYQFIDIDGIGHYTQCINTQLIPDLLMGHISEVAPDSLPAPVLSHINEKYLFHPHGNYEIYLVPKIDVRLNIVTPDNLLINPEKLFIRLWVDDEDYGTLSFNEYGNPFMHGFFYGIKLPQFRGYPLEYDPQVRAYCYYLKDDGTEVISPGASLNCPSDVALQWAKNPCEFTTPGNDVTYDLTGRQVKGDNLSPGIYIRNGRKFIISR